MTGCKIWMSWGGGGGVEVGGGVCHHGVCVCFGSLLSLCETGIVSYLWSQQSLICE